MDLLQIMMFCKIEWMHALSPTKERREFSRGLLDG